MQDVCVTVVDRLSGEARCILRHACGFAQPGRLLAVMGPSGAGKSTLMDVLAGSIAGKVRATPAAAPPTPPAAAAAAAGDLARGGAQLAFSAQREAVLDKTARRALSSAHGVAASGRVLVDGAPRRLREFRDASCYVQQEGVLLASATVREALTTAALLKLPYSVSRRGVAGRVQAVIEELVGGGWVAGERWWALGGGVGRRSCAFRGGVLGDDGRGAGGWLCTWGWGPVGRSSGGGGIGRMDRNSIPGNDICHLSRFVSPLGVPVRAGPDQLRGHPGGGRAAGPQGHQRGAEAPRQRWGGAGQGRAGGRQGGRGQQWRGVGQEGTEQLVPLELVGSKSTSRPDT